MKHRQRGIFFLKSFEDKLFWTVDKKKKKKSLLSFARSASVCRLICYV